MGVRERELKARERKMKIPIVLFVTCVASIKAASLVESFSEEQCPAHCCESTTTQAPTPPLIPQLTLQQILQLTLQEHQQQKHQQQTHQRQKLKMQQLIQTTLQTLQTLQKNQRHRTSAAHATLPPARSKEEAVELVL